jgi:hypothetical protein
MNPTAIFIPFFSMILLTMVVWFYMYARRIPFVQKNKLGPDQLKPLEFARIQPPEVANPSDNLKNLFEIPTIFYVLILYLYTTNQVDMIYITAAWIFVVFRAFHSAVHCTVNIVMLRFWLYCISTFALWFMAIRGALHELV